MVGFLEGGYNVTALAESVMSTLEVLNSRESAEEIEGKLSEESQKTSADDLTDNRNQGLVDGRLEELRSCFSRYWKELR